MFQIHGEGLSRNNLQNFFVVSGLEALRTTSLYEAYFEKKWGNNVVSLKAGQLAADSEFFNTKYTDVLTNASMGWPAITSLDLPSWGPSPPLAAVGARLLVNVTDQLSVLGGVFDGDQPGPGPGAWPWAEMRAMRICFSLTVVSPSRSLQDRHIVLPEPPGILRAS